tara:strand:+ start:631 stop:864 length:234 start_codon:yes stop_codon:yes gene_type:complete
MYKITHKLSGFIQYRNANDAADFIMVNSKKHNSRFHEIYKVEKLKEIDTEKFEEIFYSAMLLISSIALFYFTIKIFI